MKYFFIVVFSCCGILVNAQNFTVNFASNDIVIPDASYRELALYILKNQPDSVVIYGHSDSVGSDAFNKNLSKQRAQSVKDLCLANTIKATDITVFVGKGESSPVADNSTEEGRQANRRVEVAFYKRSEKPVEKPVENVVENKEEVPVPSLIPEKEIVVKKNEEFILPAIKFEAMSHRLRTESEPSLAKVVELLEKNPKMTLLITGHVCCTTSPDQDGDDIELQTKNLSVTRAKAVKEYLVSKGIDAKRLKFMGMKGNKKLFPQEKNMAEIEANRRVEFKILEI